VSDVESAMPLDASGSSITLVLMGVSGVGKSTVMTALEGAFAARYAEGDDFHPEANVRLMRAGTALTDEDRLPWLRSIAAWIGARERAAEDAVVTCSALRRTYRDLLRDGHPSVHFVHLTLAATSLESRVVARSGHYMPASLLASQLRTLEPLGSDEPGFELPADRPPAELAASIVAYVAGLDRRGR
jgi:gluconokinase